MNNLVINSLSCKAVFVLFVLIGLQACKNGLQDIKKKSAISAVALDQEIKVAENKVINSSTQSINRYSSNLRALSSVKFSHDLPNKKLDFTLENSETGQFLNINNIDIEFICPQLPYVEIKQDKFDVANLILAEYSRNGIGIPIQQGNDMFAQVDYSQDLFNDKGEYIFKDGTYKPNAGVLPKRLSVINNCLRPGLWEFSASDAVGEMYHSWFEVEKDFYYEIIENQTGIKIDLIPDDFDNPIHFEKVALDLERLRDLDTAIGEYNVSYNSKKVLGSYSSQDSRRKVQRKFFEIERGNQPFEASTQEDLEDGDKFSMFSFQEPGIYDPNNKMKLEFSRKWRKAKINYSTPKTKYSDEQEFLSSEYIEIEVLDKDKSKAIIIGNIPLALLSFKNDFVIPSFGAGVFQASERIERRLLRTTVGPHPSFAYLAEIDNEGNFNMVNNHLFGYEQIFLRPIEKGEDIYLRVTLVSYERITDLIEFEIKINNMREIINQNNSVYKPPIYETYQDDNTL